MEEMDKDIIRDYSGALDEEKQLRFKIEFYGNIKNCWINLAICLSVGFFGIHKFYLGQKNAGFLYFGMGLASIILLMIGKIVALCCSPIIPMLRTGMMEKFFFECGFLPVIFFIILGSLIALVLLILIIIDIFTFKKQTREANIEIAKTILSGL